MESGNHRKDGACWVIPCGVIPWESSAGRDLHPALGAELSRAASNLPMGVFGNNGSWEMWEPLPTA